MRTEVPLADVFVIYVVDVLWGEGGFYLQRKHATRQAPVVRCLHGNHEAGSVMVQDGIEVGV